ncbi:TAXI family TRAP transporter solute-binding subunit [Polynucleobacter necessarius]|uniref:TAXI family TRAP transporter solute-binding subunit n=1 Tax=Polynucleobacter necessarius TaxID=576610 RepID=UPI0018D5231B|nr:TAXI family TRAP transporter solute-binding subunit [Polynucleobacter necessarius]
MASFKENIQESFLGLSEAVQETWADFAQFLREAWPLLLGLLFILMGIWWYADPPPPRHVSLATGSAGGSYEALGKKYVQFFAKKGVTLELVSTNGAQENLDRLIDRHDPVQAAFVQAGVAHPKTIKGIQTLGAISYDPIWFFYRGPEVKQSDFEVVNGRSKFFAQKTISVGVEGSGTHAQAMRILNVSGLDRDLKFVYLPGKQAVKAVQAGEIDGAFIVDEFEAPNVQALLNDPNIHLVTFKRAAAFAKLIPYMHILDVPEGSFSLQRNYPSTDTTMLATTTNLLIDDRMHPAIQFLFLEAAREINGKGSFFAKRGDFPSFQDSLLPESPVAVHYEKNKYPLLATYFPFWLAELINRLVFIFLPFCAIAYPLLQSLPSFRTRRMYSKISRLYGILKTYEQDLLMNFSPERREEYLKKLDLLEYETLKLKVSQRLSGE